nr:uncharacterized protein LOC123765879 [Procambarus clarkii]
MNPLNQNILTLAALGRPFSLGMLYDCRTDNVIPGITLWDQAKLKEKAVQENHTSDFKFIASDSLEDKALALDVSASLKLSFLGGMIKLSGSGKYLEERKSSMHQERVTLQYKCTTKSEQLTMEQLGQGQVQHPYVFDHGTATHVVTGIEYGGHAFFVFDRQSSSSSYNKEVHGDLKAMIEKIPSLQIDGAGQIDITENERKKVENFSCRIVGDFRLRENPSSFEDAVRIYKNIPTLLGEHGQNAVPVKVSLYPLALLDSKASKLVREISINLTRGTERIIEDLHELDMRCNDLRNSSAAEKFHAIKSEISDFQSEIDTYKRGLQGQLSVLLPSIRGGGEEEYHLAELLKKKEASPFSCHKLNAWVQDKEKLVKVLGEYTKALSEIKFASQPGDLESMIMSPENDCILCFNILRPHSSSHLSEMKKYNGQEFDHESDHTGVEEHLNSLPGKDDEGDQISPMESTILFRNFFISNKERTGTAFVVALNLSDTSEYKAFIQCYTKGELINRNYILPSAPRMLQADSEGITHNSITINWTVPKYGASNIQKYEILCQEDNTDQPRKYTTDPNTLNLTIPNLNANCVHRVCVWSWCEAGPGPSHTDLAVSTRPTSPPGKPQVWQTSPTTVELQWTQPECVGAGCSIQNYIIKQLQESSNTWDTIASTKSDELAYSAKVAENAILTFKVAACCGAAGCSVDSDPNDHVSKKTDDKIIGADNKSLEHESRKKLKEKLCGVSKLVHMGDPCIYLLEPKLVISKDQDLIRKYELGKPKYDTDEKVILLVGATGSGKTTLINGLINYIFGVNWKDAFRFRLISEVTDSNQAKSQTKHITSYTIHHQEGFNFPHTLTIIDTPGFGDTSGVMRDREITSQIHKFFTTQGTEGIDHIDAVGFVAQSSLPRLTPTQTYIFDQILSLFGKDIADSIFLLLTFADGQPPQVLSGIKESGIPYRKHFKFNNSALYANNIQHNGNTAHEVDSDEEGNFDEMFWQMGAKSFGIFLNQLNIVKRKSLVLTQNVLNERAQLQIYISGIQLEIQKGLSTLETLKKEAEIAKTHQADIDKNKNFTYTVDEEEYKPVQIPPGTYITNCQQCNRTCHEICMIVDDDKKYNCLAITNDHCTVCPHKCHWTVHKNFPFKYVLHVVKKTKTANELRERYEKAKQKKLSAENLILEIHDEFKAVQLRVLGMTESVRKSLERLQEIALKPNPLSTLEYIDILIDSETSQAHPGWKARVEQLRMVRKEAEYMKRIADQGFDPFEEYIKKINIEKISNPKGIWAAAGQYIRNIFK